MKCQNLLDSIVTITEKYDLEDFQNQLLNLKEDLTISIAFLGEFSSGKSTLINALLGKKILPAMDTPTTAAIVEVEVGNNLKAFIEPLDSNEKQDIELSDLSEYVFGDKKNEIGKVILETPESEFFKKGFKFVDTPGTQSLEETHEDITFGYLPKVDAAILVIDINQGGATKSLINFLKEKIINESDIGKFIFVLNKIDTKNPKSVEEIVENLKKQLEDIISNPVIVPVSAKLALEGKEENNIDELKNIIIENIINNKKELIESRYCKEIAEKSKQLVSLLTDFKGSLDLSTKEIDEEIQKIKSDITKLERLEEKINKSFKTFIRTLNYKIDEICRLYVPQLMDTFLNNEEEKTQSLISIMSDELINSIKNEIQKLLKVVKQDLSLVNFETFDIEVLINSELEKELNNLKQITKVLSEIIVLGIIMIISPFAFSTEAAGYIAFKFLSKLIDTNKMENSMKESIKKESKKFFGKISDFIQEYNIPEIFLKVGVKKWKQEEITQQVKYRLYVIVDNTFDNIKIKIDEILDNEIRIPLETKKDLLERLYKEKNERIENFVSKEKEINNDILKLKQEIFQY